MTATQLSAIESDGSYYVVLMIIEERGEGERKKVPILQLIRVFRHQYILNSKSNVCFYSSRAIERAVPHTRIV
jgi:hypothetical protein